MISLILDTDFETDCDDAGALCVLHSLAQRGIVNILGVVGGQRKLAVLVASGRPMEGGAEELNQAAGRFSFPPGGCPVSGTCCYFPRYMFFRYWTGVWPMYFLKIR